MTATRVAGLANLVVVMLACGQANQPGTATPSSNRVNALARAEDCRFSMPDSSRLMGESEVDDPPRLLAPGPQVYPAELKQLGISGRVVVTYVIDREGRMVQPSLRVVEASDPAFVPATAAMLSTSRFSPGIYLGAPVAVCVQQRVNFTVT